MGQDLRAKGVWMDRKHGKWTWLLSLALVSGFALAQACGDDEESPTDASFDSSVMVDSSVTVDATIGDGGGGDGGGAMDGGGDGGGNMMNN